MNSFLDKQSCNMCKLCYRQNSRQCRDACKRCSIAMFSEDTINIYPNFQNYPYYPQYSPTKKSNGRLYYNYPSVTNNYFPSMNPYVNYYGSIYNPMLNY